MTFSNPENLTRIHELFTYANSVTEFMLGNVLLIMIFSVFFLAFTPQGGSRAFASSMIVTLISSIIFFILAIVGYQAVVISIIGVLVGIIWVRGASSN